jgi:hypothetical protein
VLDSGAPAIRQVTFTADGQSTTRAIKDKAGLTSSSRRAATSSTLSWPRACIWICSPSADAREARRRAASREEAFTAYLHRTAPDLAARLRAGHRTSPVTGMLRTPNHIRRAHGSGWALVGDAGYHRDAVTGQGLSDAATPNCWPPRSTKHYAATPTKAPPSPDTKTGATRPCATSSI